MSSPWIQHTLAGVFCLRNFGPRTQGVIQAAIAQHRGGDFGGLDLMPPNAADEAWLLVGAWADCWRADIRDAIAAFDEALGRVVELDRAGITLGASSVALDTSHGFPDATRGELRPLYAYGGGIAHRWWEGDERVRLEAIFPTLPHYVGIHMGAPHWLGRGVEGNPEAGLRSVTPYIRIDFDDGRGVRVSGMAEPGDFETWLRALRAATGWP